MLAIKSFVEFIGTFVFLAVILNTGSAIPIGAALATAIFFGGDISGGHFNPAVSLMMYINKSISTNQFITYIVAQCLGGICALMLYKLSKK